MALAIGLEAVTEHERVQSTSKEIVRLKTRELFGPLHASAASPAKRQAAEPVPSKLSTRVNFFAVSALHLRRWCARAEGRLHDTFRHHAVSDGTTCQPKTRLQTMSMEVCPLRMTNAAFDRTLHMRRVGRMLVKAKPPGKHPPPSENEL